MRKKTRKSNEGDSVQVLSINAQRVPRLRTSETLSRRVMTILGIMRHCQPVPREFLEKLLLRLQYL